VGETIARILSERESLRLRAVLFDVALCAFLLFAAVALGLIAG
jgi:hypothetical protein